MDFRADGRQVTASVDTGSDLDFVSYECAMRNGFKINRDRTTSVMLADESVIETVGEVDIAEVQLPGFEKFGMSLHVLPGLPCDLIFGEEFLEWTDAFNRFDIVDNQEEWYTYSCIFVNLGRFQSFLSSFIRKKDPGDGRGIFTHQEQLEKEMYNRYEAERLIGKMKDRQEAATASEQEVERRRRFENKRIGCAYCFDESGPHVLGPRGGAILGTSVT